MNALKRGGALSLVVGALLLLVMLALGITEETPLGSVRGSVRMSESGLPLPGAVVMLTSINTGPDAPKPRVAFADKAGAFNFLNVPAGDYKIEASAKAHDLPSTWVSVQEGAPTPLDLELTPKDPELRIYSSQRVFFPDEPAQVEAHGFGLGDRLAVKVYKLDLSHFLNEGSIYGVLYSLTDNPYSDRKRQPPEALGKLVASEDHKIQNADAEGSFMDVISVPKLSEGFYWVQCSMGNLVRGAFLSVTKIALVTKSSPGQTLAFVTDLKTGQPVSGVPVSIDDNKTWKPVATTNADGVAQIKMPDENRKVLVLATLGGSNAVSAFYGRSSRGYDDEEEGSDVSQDTTLFTYTDRPLYRPGDDVQFKGFARIRKGSDYTVPSGGKVICEVRNDSDDLLDRFPLDVSASGSFHGHFATEEDLSPGDYYFKFKGLGGEHQMHVGLSAYRKPEFSVKVTWSKPHYILGDKLEAKVKCEYYFGGPVAGAKVSAWVTRNQVWSYYDDSDDEDYGSDEEGDYSGGGEYFQELEGVTDANGEAVFTFSPKEEKRDDNGYDFYSTPEYEYTLNASVVEAGDKYFEGKGSVKVSQGAFDLSVQTDRYMVAPGQAVEVTLKATKVDNREPVPGQELQITYGIETWARNESVFTALGQQVVKMGADGTAKVNLQAAREGSFVIRASGQDERGNTVREQAYVYVGTDSFEPPPSAGPLSVTLDKALYKPGDTCKALVSLARPGASVLLTIESEHVLWSKVVRLKDRSAVVDIPVLKSYLPRVTVAAACVQNKKFLEESKALKIDVDVRRMKIAISSDKAKYLPGEKATYRLQTLGPDGKPVSADLSLAVVDEAIYALQADTTNPLKAFYPARPNMVETNYSFPELYLDGGDKAGDIPIRMNFKDTAAWFPAIRTDAQGSASVSLNMPDNLTSWRATAVGVSDQTDVGMATQNVVVAKPLMVRLQGPRYMVAGDRQQVAAIVTNHSGRDADVRVSLQPTGFSTRDRLEQSVSVGNDQTASVSWDLSTAKAGRGVLVAKAWIAGGATDGVQQIIQIQPHARQVRYRGAGDVAGSAAVQVVRRNDADPAAGGVKLSISPTIGTSVYNALDELINYPYGCVEQTMSRFLPAMVVGRSLEGVGLLRPDLKRKIPEIASRSISKLEEMHHGDGGWGWWQFDKSDPFMTAYVLDGLKVAEAAGYKSTPFMKDKALEWEAAQIKSADSQKWTLRARLYVIYTLALYGKKAEASAALKTINVDAGGPAQKAVGVLAADALGEEWTDKRDQWLRELRSSVVEGTVTASWAPYMDVTYWWDEQDVYGAEVSALPLLALQKVTPDDPIIGKGVRGLLASRRGNWWWSTRDSSFALRAIADYMKGEELPGAGAVAHIKLNGRPLPDVRMEAKDLMIATPQIFVPTAELATGANAIQITLEGAKRAYYSYDMLQYPSSAELGRLVSGEGFTLTRSYHLLRSERMEDGTYRLQGAKESITQARSGDLIQCTLTVKSSRPRSYVMVTDPFPSNCHVQEGDYRDFGDYEWNYWYSERTVYDDRITFFARDIPAGIHEFTYVLKAESPGISHALPPVAENMYNPDDRTSDAETEFEVRR